MRTNIDIDDALMADAMKAGPYTTKKDAVEAGLKLLARQAAYREVAKWRGKLQWEGDDAVDWVAAQRTETSALAVQEPVVGFAAAASPAARPAAALAVATATKARRARR